jgi:lysozyme family protein
MSFSDSLSMVLQFEGGFVDNPADPGGATNQGVTQAVYDRFRAEHGLAIQSVRLIQSNEVAAIYQVEYWLAAHCDKLTHPLDSVVFDCAVNSGVRESTQTLQRALGIEPDGSFGPVTLAASLACHPSTVAVAYLDLRDEFYKDLAAAKPALHQFLRGWLDRIILERARLGLPA